MSSAEPPNEATNQATEDPASHLSTDRRARLSQDYATIAALLQQFDAKTKVFKEQTERLTSNVESVTLLSEIWEQTAADIMLERDDDAGQERRKEGSS